MTTPRQFRRSMNWDCIEGQWKQRRGEAVQHWGKMMNDELAAIAGRYEKLVGRLQEDYGTAREEASVLAARYKKATEQLEKSERRLMELKKVVVRKEKPDGSGKRKPGRKHKGH
jgi:uncharacterized protein YjbJ (UPF0337 family)